MGRRDDPGITYPTRGPSVEPLTHGWTRWGQTARNWHLLRAMWGGRGGSKNIIILFVY
jgi:hypothetical protein